MTENNAAKAVQEAERIAAADEYFKARAWLMDTNDNRRVFEAGFDRAYALLSKLRAEGVQAGDERISIRGAANLAFNALHECTPVKGAEKQYSDAIQALQSALHDIAYTVNRTATAQQFADHLQREARAALASAPVAGEAHRIFLVPTGEVYCGQETYTRHEGQPPVNTDNECLYAAPQASEADEEDAADAWRRLALQFDGHRMQALAHLRAMLADPQAHAEQTTEFLSAPPLSGDQMLAERIRALSAQPGAQKNDIPAHLLERLRHHAADKANTAFARSTMNELAGYLSPTQPTEQGERDV